MHARCARTQRPARSVIELVRGTVHTDATARHGTYGSGRRSMDDGGRGTAAYMEEEDGERVERRARAYTYVPAYERKLLDNSRVVSLRLFGR